MEGSIVRSPFWPEHSAHRDFWERHNCAHVYEYDPTDDGPEAMICCAVYTLAYQYRITRRGVDRDPYALTGMRIVCVRQWRNEGHKSRALAEMLA